MVLGRHLLFGYLDNSGRSFLSFTCFQNHPSEPPSKDNENRRQVQGLPFWLFRGVSKSVQVLFNGIEALQLWY